MKENKWKVTIIELESNYKKEYKVTRRIPCLKLAETRVFQSKEEAKKQFEDWMNL